MKKTITLIFIFAAAALFTAAGQTNEELADEKVRLAIDLMDQGSYKESLLLLDEAEKLHPGTSIYDYERAYAYYSQEDYARAIKLLKKAAKFPDATALVYQLMGNAYDLSGKPQKALDTYAQGLKKFPGSGRLYLESGVVYARQNDYNKALSYYLTGIESDPYYPSNYYQAAYIYLHSTEKVWGMIYGETFMNLERGTGRTPRMGKWLYDAYDKSIGFEGDSITTISFSENIIIPMNPDEENQPDISVSMLYELCTGIAVGGETEISLASLDRIRTRFVEEWFNDEYIDGEAVEEEGGLFGSIFDLPILRFQKKVLDAGHFEAYNYWLLGDADLDAFNAWRSDNEDKYDEFIKWMIVNPLILK